LYDLKTILASADPHTLLKAKSPNDFKYFGTVAKLIELLYTKATAANLNELTPQLDKADDPIILKYPVTALKGHSFDLQVKVRNREKDFLTSYFNLIRNNINLKPMLDGMNPFSYYDLTATFKNNHDALLAFHRSINTKSAYICEDATFARYQQFLKEDRQFAQSQLSALLKSDWMKYLVWMNEGELRLNPFNFTDEEKLPYKSGYNIDKASARDAYINDAISQMLKAKELNPQKTSIALFDSLQAQQQKGRDKFSYKAENELMKIANEKKAKSFLSANTMISKTTFKLIDNTYSKKYLLQVYQAQDTLLLRSANILDRNFSNDLALQTTVYNLAGEQTYKVKITNKSHSGESKIITDLKQIGGLGAELTPLALQALPNIVNFTSKTSVPYAAINQIKNIPFTYAAEVAKDGKENFIDLTVTMHLKEVRGRLYILTYQNSKKIGEIDLFESVDQWLYLNGLRGCTDLKNRFYLSIKEAFSDFKSNSFSLTDINVQANKIQAKLKKSIEDEINKLSNRKTTIVAREIERMIAEQSQLAQLLKSDDLLLPPDALELTDNQAAPNFRNEFFGIPQEDGAKERNLSIALYNAKGKVTDSITEKFATSSKSWVTGSLGIAYVVNSFRRSDATVANNEVNTVADEQQTRLIAGLHFYPWKILLSDNRFIGQLKWQEIPQRLGFFVGFSFPKAFSNPHFGVSADLWPGIKLTGGLHLYRYTGYEIRNNQIIDQQTRYRSSGAFLSLNIEPVTFTKLIGIFK
jgi:hypothetical protein